MQIIAHLALYVIALIILVALILGLLSKAERDDRRIAADQIQAPAPVTIRRICMDCGLVLEEADAPHVTSHGLCPICAQLRVQSTHHTNL